MDASELFWQVRYGFHGIIESSWTAFEKWEVLVWLLRCREERIAEAESTEHHVLWRLAEGVDRQCERVEAGLNPWSSSDSETESEASFYSCASEL